MLDIGSTRQKAYSRLEGSDARLQAVSESTAFDSGIQLSIRFIMFNNQHRANPGKPRAVA